MTNIIKTGTKIVIGMTAGMSGTNQMTACILRRDYPCGELDDLAWQMGLDHASMYGVHPTEYTPDNYDEELDGDTYSDSIEGWWELYNEEKHSGNCSYGGSVDFEEI